MSLQGVDAVPARKLGHLLTTMKTMPPKMEKPFNLAILEVEQVSLASSLDGQGSCCTACTGLQL